MQIFHSLLVIAVLGEGEALQGEGTQVASAVMMRATIFGEFRLWMVGDDPIVLNNRRGNLVLAILCLQPDLMIDRASLAALLWSERFPAQAKASLRQCLHDLTRQLAELQFHGLIVTRTGVALDRKSLECDLHELEAGLAQGDTDDAAERLENIGNQLLLQGAALNPAFDEWLAARRKHVDARIKAAVSGAIPDTNTPAAKRLLDAVRVRFPTYRTSAQALGRISLAVLPFEQFDEVGGDFFFAEGVVDELCSRLGMVNEIGLAGRTSIGAIAGKGGTLPQMAADLGVSHLVEGTVRRTADTIEVRMTLIEGASGIELWSERIEGSIGDFLQSRKVIGANVIAAICSALGFSPSPAPMRRMTSNREAYALYLQGRSLIQRSLTDGAPAKAVELLEQSLAMDPNFAECWSALADAHIHIAVYTPCLDRVERSEKAAECAKRAVELDPAQGQALAVQGIHEWTQKNPAGALDLAFEAYAREPQSADVASRLGSFLLYIGRTRDALPYVEVATEQDPVNGRNFAMLSTVHFNLGNFKEALAAGQRMVDLGMPTMWLAAIQSAQGNYDEATATYYASRMQMNTVILPPAGTEPMSIEARDAYWNIAAKGCCSGKAEDRALYCQMLNGLQAAMPDPCDSSIAFPAIWMGHSELVMKLYREQIHPANMYGLMSLWADSDPIRRTREHPDFMGFAEEIGLAGAWDRYGWPDLMPVDPRTAKSRTN